MVSPEFLRLAFFAAYPTLRVLSEDSGSTKGAITCEDLKRFKDVLPQPEEQAKLVEYVHAQTESLDNCVFRTEREINLIREYRTTLTAEIVTGKLDVREAVQHLPAVAEQPLPPDELSADDLEDEASEELAP